MANHAALIRQENSGLSIAQRGRRFIEFDLGNGQRRFVSTIEPLHIRNSETEIDTTWLADTGAWQWKLAQADFQAHARSVFNVGSLIEWRHESGEWVIVDPQSINWINQNNSRQQITIKQAVTGVADDMTLSFPNAYGSGRHFSYTAHPRRLIKHITIDALSNLPAPTVTGTIHFEAEWTIANSSGIELYLDGVRWARSNNVRVRTANRIEFKASADAEALWYADAPVATDANGETTGAEYEVRRQGGTYFITVRVPREWLLSAVYPVMIDPTFTDGYGGDVTTAKDTSVAAGGAAANNYGASDALFVRNGTQYKALLEFDLSSIPSDATCDSATLYTYKYTTAAAGAVTVTVYSIASGNDSWPEGNKAGAAGGAGDCCWSYYDQDPGSEVSWAGSAGLSTSGTDYEVSSIGSFDYDQEDAEGTENTSALTAARVEGWFGFPNTNYGILMWGPAGHTTGSARCASDHATTGYRPKLVVEYTPIGGPTYTLTAEQGALSLAGQTAALLAARVLGADAGSLSLGGQSASLLAGRLLTAAQGTLGFSGQTASLLASRLLAAAQGTVSFAGQAASLLAGRKLSADAGAISLTGQDATLLVARLLEAAAGTISLTGIDATLTYTPIGGPTYTLIAETGTLSMSGQAAALLAARLLTGEAGVISLTGQDAAVLRGFLLSAEAGAISVAGQDAGLTLARLLTAESGTLTLAGQAVTLLYSGSVSATPDSRIFVIVAEGRVYIIAAESRTYAVPGESRVYAINA